MTMKLEVYPQATEDDAEVDLSGQPKNVWRWRLTGANGEITESSNEAYYAKEDAERNYLLFLNEGYAAWVEYCKQKVAGK